MGLFNTLRSELVDVIEWVDDARHTLVWRFPRYRNQIKNGARLIVRPGQVAIFVREGKLADVFEPGHHTLSTRNLPILSTLMGWKYGFDSPFMAEVYFVSTKEVTDLKWGTPNPVTLRDEDFGPIRVRAFGNYSLRAVDPQTLVEELVGTDSSFDMDEISELIRAIIISSFSTAVSRSDISVLDLAGSYPAIGEQTRATTIERIDDEYGLDVPQLVVVNVSLPAEVEKALDTRTRMNLLGDMGQYRDYQMAQALPAMAAGDAGGMVGSAMGLGVGMNMANQMMGNLGQGNALAIPVAAPPPPPPQVAWHLVEGGQSVGPLSLGQLAEAVASGRLRPETLVWSAGMQGWRAAGELPQLAGLLSASPPPIPGS